MIGILAAALILVPQALGWDEPAKPKPKCPPDTVYYHIKTHTDWIYGMPVETVDTTWVITGKAK